MHIFIAVSYAIGYQMLLLILLLMGIWFVIFYISFFLSFFFFAITKCTAMKTDSNNFMYCLGDVTNSEKGEQR
jgi:hypothetical protein